MAISPADLIVKRNANERERIIKLADALDARILELADEAIVADQQVSLEFRYNTELSLKLKVNLDELNEVQKMFKDNWDHVTIKRYNGNTIEVSLYHNFNKLEN